MTIYTNHCCYQCRRSWEGVLRGGLFMVMVTVPGFVIVHHPQGHDLRSLTHANGNSQLVATHPCNKGVSPVCSLHVERSQLKGQGFSHHCYPAPAVSKTNTQNTHPLATPPNTHLLLNDIIALIFKSGGFWTRMEPLKDDSSEA